MRDDDINSGLSPSGFAGSITHTVSGNEIARREGYRYQQSPPLAYVAQFADEFDGYATIIQQTISPPNAESGRVGDSLYASPPTTPESPSKVQLNEYRREQRFMSLGGAFRPLTSSESGETIVHTFRRSSWFNGDDLTVRPRFRALGKLLRRLGSLVPPAGISAINRLTSRLPIHSENSTIAERKDRARQQSTLPVYTRWRYKRNHRLVFLMIMLALFFSYAIRPHIIAIPVRIPTLYHREQFHYTQRRLAGTPHETVQVAKEQGRGYKQRMKKVLKTITARKEGFRHDIQDGLLNVNMSLPVSAHPIKQLIKDAHDQWRAKNARQSKTLKQAVAEYKRRNRGLAPPKGFDKWWRFVV
ncbi:hypothetical protein QFC19_003533 [Naganishia cerealis]|uniref:Uncharacterized protein n=1 Tax=Naganishia cerealis TaxID=610337 RepID=A0ACC2W3V9_9TREE|nr:hypothetical protein QFC19_003533 [Naganishia cerealis]